MMADIQRLVTKDLSEPYSVFTYRYFLHNGPRFCICAYSRKDDDPATQVMIATIVCKLEGEGDQMQGYMAMLAVDQDYRKRGIAQKLVTMVIDRMVEDGCKEVMLETEVCRVAAVFTPAVCALFGLLVRVVRCLFHSVTLRLSHRSPGFKSWRASSVLKAGLRKGREDGEVLSERRGCIQAEALD